MRKHLFCLAVVLVGAFAFGAPPPSTYVVRPGDTLGSIAVRFHTTVGGLASLNHIQNVNVISVGQDLKLGAPVNGIGRFGSADGQSLKALVLRVAGPAMRYWKPLFPLPGIAVVVPWLLLIVWAMFAARRRRDAEGILRPGRAPAWLPWLAVLPLALVVAAPYVSGLPKANNALVTTSVALGVHARRTASVAAVVARTGSNASSSQLLAGNEQPAVVGAGGNGIRSQQQWDALFNAGKVMVGCGGNAVPDWDPNKQASYAFRRCAQPVWSSQALAETRGSSDAAGVRALLALSTPNGMLTLLDYYNSYQLAESGHTITLFYLQASDGYDGLVGYLDNWGPVKLQRLGDSFRLTTQAPVYMGGDPMCCPSIILNATFAGTGTGLQLVDRRTQFEQSGSAAQRLTVALQKRGYDEQQVSQVMNQVASIALSPSLSNQQKQSQYQQLAQTWGEGVLSTAVSIMPVFNPNTNQWQSFGSWANQQASQLPGDSQFKQDPVGSTVRLLFDPSPSNISQTLGLGNW